MNPSQAAVHFVMPRFMEPWDKVLEFYGIISSTLPPSTEWSLYVYDRGATGDAIPTRPRLHHVPDKNVGRETYPILRHMHDFYGSLPDILVFVPAHWWSPIRLQSLGHIFPYMHLGYMPMPCPCPWESIQGFTLDAWDGSEVNREAVRTQAYTRARIRPFGEWYKQRIAVPYKNLLNYCGIFSCHRASVLRYPRERIADWMRELEEDGVNPEIAHYWERSFYSVFS